MITENKFEWTDELVGELANWYKSEQGICRAEYWGKDLLEEFKKSKQQNTIQKDWEIMSFVVKSSRVVLGKTEEGDFGNNIFRIDENELLKSPNHKINSVKRISDGEVFSLGDDVNFGIIEGFYICEEEDSFCYKCMMVYFKEVRANRDISELKKVNQPLFKTEDGKDVYEGGEFVAVQKTTFDMLCCRQTLTNPENYYIFSNEEKANNWVLMNKPVLSVNDIVVLCEKTTLSKIKTTKMYGVDWANGSEYYDVSTIDLDKLKELAKSKIENK